MKVIKSIVFYLTGIFMLLSALVFIGESLLAAFFMAATGLLILPIVRATINKKLKKPIKRRVYAVVIVILFIMIIAVMPESENYESEPTKMVSKTTNEATEINKGTIKPTETTEITSNAIETTTVPAKTQEEKNKEIKDNINKYFEDNKDKYVKNLSKYSETEVWNVMKSDIANIFANSSEDMSSSDKTNINKYLSLYKSVFPNSNNSEYKSASAMFDEMLSLNKEIENLSKNSKITYKNSTYNLLDCTIQNGTWYIAQRSTTGSDIMDALGSLTSGSSSEWFAYNVEYIMGSEYPGDNSVVVYSNQENPFTKTGAYNFDYIELGETVTLKDSKGFKKEAPVLYMIDDVVSLEKNANQYEEKKNQYANKYSQLSGIFSGNSAVNTAQANKNTSTNAATSNEYILPESDSRYINESDLANLSDEELNLAKNEIYARHGRIFKNEKISSYFNSKSWYNPTISADDFDESYFNEYEKANINFIVKYIG